MLMYNDPSIALFDPDYRLSTVGRSASLVRPGKIQMHRCRTPGNITDLRYFEIPMLRYGYSFCC